MITLDFSKLETIPYQPKQPQLLPDQIRNEFAVLESEADERQRTRNIYYLHQQYINRAKELRAEILKGTQCGKTAEQLLPLALDCISLMTGQPEFSEQAKENLQIIHTLETGSRPPTLPDMQHRLHLIKRCIDAELEKYKH